MSGVSLCAVAPLLTKRNGKTKAETSLKYMTLILFERSKGSKRSCSVFGSSLPDTTVPCEVAAHEFRLRYIKLPRGVDGRQPQAGRIRGGRSWVGRQHTLQRPQNAAFES